jgi:hypothetical protein
MRVDEHALQVVQGKADPAVIPCRPAIVMAHPYQIFAILPFWTGRLRVLQDNKLEPRPISGRSSIYGTLIMALVGKLDASKAFDGYRIEGLWIKSE